jgi:acyl-CoA oxidase
VLELQSARYLVRQLAAAREGTPITGLCEYLSPCKERGYNTAKETSTSASSVSEFHDLSLLLKLFRGRALSLVVSAGDRVELDTKRLGSADQAWNGCAIDLVTASRAHCYYVMLDNFASSLTKIDDPKARESMSAVCRFFALENMISDMGAFELSVTQKQLVREALRALLPLIRNDLIGITDAFEFPDNVLNSALGRHDGKVYESLYAAAKLSPLNRQDPFPGYAEHLKPNLNLEFIKEKSQEQRSTLTPKL